ncbi:MAG: MOSC domain-containing protein [Desulfuromonadales bacterium]
MISEGKIVAVCSSTEKGMRKTEVGKGLLVENFGLQGDAHGGHWHRQVSLLALESIHKMRTDGLDVGPGDFAENLTTEGIELCRLPIGSLLELGSDGVLLEITQIGKICHDRCAIYHQAGDCVMPKEGVFAVVRREGIVTAGDAVKVLRQGEEAS